MGNRLRKFILKITVATKIKGSEKFRTDILMNRIGQSFETAPTYVYGASNVPPNASVQMIHGNGRKMVNSWYITEDSTPRHLTIIKLLLRYGGI